MGVILWYEKIKKGDNCCQAQKKNVSDTFDIIVYPTEPISQCVIFDILSTLMHLSVNVIFSSSFLFCLGVYPLWGCMRVSLSKL